MPGRLLHRIARRWFAAGLCERVFEPLIGDLQREWADAVPAARRSIALARGYVGFWHALVACGIQAISRGALSPMASDMAMPATLAFVCAPLGVTVLRFVGASRSYWHQPARAFVLGELQTLGWSVVFAMVPAFMYARPRPNRDWNATTSRLLIAGVGISIVCVGWVGPALFGAHEHARGRFLDDHIQPAFQTLPTVVRLVRDQAAADAVVWQRALQSRLAMIADAVLLGLIGWQLSAIRRPSIGRAFFWWFALMELVLVSGAYAGRDLWLQWRATFLLAATLLTLRVRGPRARIGSALSTRPI